MVYVDDLMLHGFKMYGKDWPSCHMFADTDKELNEIAGKIEMKPAWLQTKKAWFHHYDLIESKRKKAVSLGAKELSKSEFVEYFKEKLKDEKGKK